MGRIDLFHEGSVNCPKFEAESFTSNRYMAILREFIHLTTMNGELFGKVMYAMHITLDSCMHGLLFRLVMQQPLFQYLDVHDNVGC